MASDGTLGDGGFGPRRAAYNSCSVSLRGSGSSRTPGRTPTLAIFGPLGAVWCVISARVIATVSRSCRSHERSRRCRRLIAEKAACSPCRPLKAQRKFTNVRATCLSLGWWWWWWCGPSVTEVSLSIPLHACSELWCQVTRESDSRRPRLLPEPSSTHSW